MQVNTIFRRTFLIVTLVVFLAVGGTALAGTIESSRPTPKGRWDEFKEGDRIYGWGTNWGDKLKSFQLYITRDRVWVDGSIVPDGDIIKGFPISVQNDTLGEIFQLIWDSPKKGKYDIWIDADPRQDGKLKYNLSGGDAIDDLDIGSAGFIVTPLFMSTSVLTFLAGLGILAAKLKRQLV